MLRFLSLFCVAAVLAFAAVKVSAEVVDRGPPYSGDDFLALSPTILPNGFAAILPGWWSKAPDYLKKRILASRSDMWWPIIQCNYMGFKPEGMDVGGAEKCEKDAYKSIQRGKSFWSADGQWIGPSEECRKRDKRTQWGELICD
jgi:hypothetical protein